MKSKKKRKNKKSNSITLPAKCTIDSDLDLTKYQNGKCDLILNTPSCLYDGGDCTEFNTLYPNCSVAEPNWISDGYCDGELYNTTFCGYDGGDCIGPNVVIDYGCSGAGNGYCENIFNNDKCNYDGGDCDSFNTLYPECKVPDPSYVGDGLCDDVEPYFTSECGMDGGDCDDFPEGCNLVDKYVVGDGNCDVELNTTECEFDGGDCLL